MKFLAISDFQRGTTATVARSYLQLEVTKETAVSFAALLRTEETGLPRTLP